MATQSRETAKAPDRRPARTSPGVFVRQVVAELRKVVWPTRDQLVTYWVVVLVFVVFMIAVVSLIDLGAGWALFKAFA
jgi:preprotein translocase subunit SecE